MVSAEEQIDQLNGRAFELYQQRQFSEAIETANLAYNLARALLGEEHEKTVAALNNLAELHRVLGNDTVAEPLLERSLALARETFGETHANVGLTLNNLAVLHYQRGDYDKALVQARQAFEILLPALGPAHVSVANLNRSLAAITDKLGDRPASVDYLYQAVLSDRGRLGDADDTVIEGLANVARQYEELGNLGSAESAFRDLLAVVRARFGDASAATAGVLERLAAVKTRQRHHDAAVALYRDAIAIRRTAAGTEPLPLADSLDALAMAHSGAREYEVALPLMTEALDLRRTALGPANEEVARTLNNVGALHIEMGHYVEAEQLYQQAIDIVRRASGENTAKYGSGLANLANFYHRLGRYDEAEPRYVRAIEVLRTTLGADHPNIATVIHNLGDLYYRTGRYAAAERLFEDALAIKRRAFGDEHPSLAATMAELAGVYSASGRLDAAGPLLARALEIDRAAFGDGHMIVQNRRRQLVAHYVRAGDDKAADALLRAELERVRHAATDPQLIAAAMEELAELCEKHGSPEAVTLRTDSLTIRRAAGRNGALARSLVVLAELHHAGGNYAAAEPLYQEALTTWQSESDPPIAEVASTLVRLGDLCAAAGEPARSKPLYFQAMTLFHGIGQAQQAISPAGKIVEIARAAAEADPTTLMLSLNDLAELYRESSALDAAGPLYKEALELAKTLKETDQSVTAMLLNNLGMLHSARGDYAAARGPLERAVAIGRTVGGRTLAFALNNLGQVYQSVGDFGAAAPLFEESVELRRREFGDVSPEVATGLHNLGRLELAAGKYAAAKEHLKRALAVRRACGGEGHPAYAVSLVSLSEVHFRIGDLGSAENMLQLALHIQQGVLSAGDPAIGLTLGNLGAVHIQLGRFAYAEQLLRQGGEILRRELGERHPYVAQNATLLANLFSATGNHGAAEEHFTRAISITRANGDRIWLATLLNNLALLYESQGRVADAIGLLLDALAIRRETLGEAHADVGQTLNNLATISMWLDPARSKSLLQSALAIRRGALGPTHNDVAETLNNLAAIDQALGEFAAAEPLLREAVDIRRRGAGEVHPDFALTLHNLAMVMVALGRPAEGLALSRQVEDIHDGFIAQISGIASERRRMELVARLGTTFEAFLSLVLQHFRDDPASVSAACTLVLSRKALGAEALTVQRDAVLGGRYPQLASTMREVAMLRAEIAEKTLAIPSGVDANAESLRGELRALIAKKEALESELARQVPEVGMARATGAATAASVARALPADTALIEYAKCAGLNFSAAQLKGEPLFTTEHYIAFVLPAGEPEAVKMFDLGEADHIDALIAKLRESITGETEPGDGSARDDGAMEDAGKSLRAAVFEPLVGSLGGRTRLFIAPDGDLSRLPFEALPSVDGRRLIDDFLISYLSAGRDVMRFAVAASIETTAPLVVADPDFDLGDVSEKSEALPRASEDATFFEALPETRIEGEQIAQMLGVQAIVGPDVLESTIKRQRSPRVVHIATHGFFEPDVDRSLDEAQRTLALPTDGGSVVLRHVTRRSVTNSMLRSGLALAGANGRFRAFSPPREAEDGILTAEDVGMLELTGTDLVVLSACETGLGTIRRGEGVFGLRRAFAVAGARTLVMSLWKVPDLETRELMVEMYRRLLAGERCADAMRASQLSMKSRKPEPFYWAAFICQGNPGPLGNWRITAGG